MEKPTIKIQGTKINTNRQPLSNLRIEAWYKDLIIDDFVAIYSNNINLNH